MSLASFSRWEGDLVWRWHDRCGRGEKHVSKTASRLLFLSETPEQTVVLVSHPSASPSGGMRSSWLWRANILAARPIWRLQKWFNKNSLCRPGQLEWLRVQTCGCSYQPCSAGASSSSFPIFLTYRPPATICKSFHFFDPHRFSLVFLVQTWSFLRRPDPRSSVLPWLLLQLVPALLISISAKSPRVSPFLPLLLLLLVLHRLALRSILFGRCLPTPFGLSFYISVILLTFGLLVTELLEIRYFCG